MASAEFDIQEAFTRLYDRINEIHTDVTVTKTKLEGLVGNGQPGEIQKIQSRLSSLEEFKNKSVGYLTAVTGALTALGVVGHYLVDLFRAKH